MSLLDRLRRHRAPDPLDHDTEWHGDLDDVRDELDVRRTHRAMHDHQPPTTDRQADRGQETGSTP